MTALRLLAIGLLAAGLVAPAGVGAQTAGGSKPSTPGAEVSIQDKELQAFAMAAREVFRIRQDFAPKVQSATSEIDARDIIVAAEKEMSDVIRGEGLTVARYNEILKAAQGDPALAARIQTLVDKAAAR